MLADSGREHKRVEMASLMTAVSGAMFSAASAPARASRLHGCTTAVAMGLWPWQRSSRLRSAAMT